MNKLLSALLVLAPAITLSSLAWAEGEAAKVAVLPFTPLSGDVPNNAGSKATEVLLTVLKAVDGLNSEDASASGSEDPAEHLKKANELLAGARKKLDAGQPYAAKTDLQTALTEFAAGAAALEDTDAISDTYSALARSLYQTGADADALKALDAAEALSPGREFAESKSSVLFASLATQEKDRVLALDKGSLKINSVPQGATARIDGQEAGKTPVRISDLPPGPHLWRVELPSSGSVGGVVEVGSSKKVEVLGAAASKGPAAPLVSALASNSLSAESIKAMKEAAAGLNAAWLVFGGLHTENSDLVLDSFVYSAKANNFARLPKVKFDADLVSAGQELTKVANDLAGRANANTLGNATAVPARVSEEIAPADATEVAEYHFPAPGSDTAPKKDSGPRKVVGGHHGPVTKQK
jgi:hypothetical protein